MGCDSSILKTEKEPAELVMAPQRAISVLFPVIEIHVPVPATRERKKSGGVSSVQIP